MIALSLAMVGWGFASFVFGLAAFTGLGRLLGRSRAAAARSRASWPTIAILRPCEGLEPGLHENLLSAATARYDGVRELWLLVPSADDPAYAVAQAVVEEARRLAPKVIVHLEVTAIDTGANRKVAQLARARTTAEVIVVADSDMRLDERTLPGLLAVLLDDERAGASSAAYHEAAVETLGDRLSAALLSSTPHCFLCLAALAERSGGAHVLAGGLVAIRARVLEEVGGFASLESYLGEDFELARRLHARGYSIPTAPEPVRIFDRGRSVTAVVRRFARWCTVTRRQRPHLFPTYVLLLGCTPLVMLGAILAALAGAPLAGWAAGFAVAAMAVRTAVAMRLRAAYGLPWDPLRALVANLAGELLIVVATFGALGPPVIEWRGHRYHVGVGGVLQRLK